MKKIILLVPSPFRGGQCLDCARHKGRGLPRAKSRGQFGKPILFTAGLIVCLAVSVWAENKSKTVKSEPTPIKVENPIQQEKATPTAYEIPWTSINGGGELASTSANYKIRASTAQSVIGESQSTNYKMGIGFWYGPGIYCTSRPGDANANGSVNLTDIIFLVSYIFRQPSPAPSPLCRGDANGNGAVNLTDIIYLVSYIFRQPSPPPVKAGVCCL